MFIIFSLFLAILWSVFGIGIIAKGDLNPPDKFNIYAVKCGIIVGPILAPIFGVLLAIDVYSKFIKEWVEK